MTPNGTPQPPRAENCEFRIFSTPPATGFVEVGAIDVEPGGYGSNVYTQLAEFKEKIQPYVCRAGGDAAIAYANGYGMYIKATVLKAVAPAAAVASNASAPQPQASDDGACHYDTQCKGARICVKGDCVEPPAVPAPAATATPVAP